MYFSSHFSRSMVVTTITIHLGFSVRRVYTRDSLFSAGREEGVLLKDRDRERFSIGTTKDSLGGKVKEKGVVVVELIQRSTLVSCDETKSEEEGKRIESLQCDQSYWYILLSLIKIAILTSSALMCV